MSGYFTDVSYDAERDIEMDTIDDAEYVHYRADIQIRSPFTIPWKLINGEVFSDSAYGFAVDWTTQILKFSAMRTKILQHHNEIQNKFQNKRNLIHLTTELTL